MRVYRSVYLLLFTFLAACSQTPVQTSTNIEPQKASQDYEAIGNAEGIHPYVYGRHTLIKFDAGKPSFLSIKDEEGAAVAYKLEGGYYVLDRKLDSFTMSESGRLVVFNIIQPQLPNSVVLDSKPGEQELQKLDTVPSDSNNELSANLLEVKIINPIFTIMRNQLQYQRKLLNIASQNPNMTGEDISQINSRLDITEHKFATQIAVVNVNFPFNSIEFNPETELINALLPMVKNATSIYVYGRTDSKIADVVNMQIAEGRATAAKNFLISNGVPAQIIHSSAQASGDFIAPAGMKEGRKLNRRVTIEVITQQLI